MSPTTIIERGNAQNELFSRSEVERILSNMLKSKPSGLLLEYEVVPECGPTGYLGEYFHLQLKYRTAEVMYVCVSVCMDVCMRV